MIHSPFIYIIINIKYSFERKYGEEVNLEPLNDEFEEKCREQLLSRFLENK